MCSKWLAPTIDYWQPPLLNELELVATIVDKRARGAAAMDAYKRGMILESKVERDESGEKCREQERKWRAAMAAAASAARELGVEFE